MGRVGHQSACAHLQTHACRRQALGQRSVQLRANVPGDQSHPRAGRSMSFLDRLFRRRAIYENLAEEVQAHLDEKIDALIAQGMSNAEATAAARRSFGNVTNVVEQGRATWEWPSLESFALDVRYALRQLGRAPALS